MSWMVIICLLGAGGRLREAHSMDSIVEINENIPKDNPVRRRLIEGDIVTTRTSRFSPKMSLWPKGNDNKVSIAVKISAEYGEIHRKIIKKAFKDVENGTCIRFVEYSMGRDFISIVPGEGCYSQIGRVRGEQELSLAFECVERGKGVVLHELLHVIGFWHEHARADRDNYVIIHWKNIREDYMRNFCKQETTNMLLAYDYGSLLHYSSIAFSKNRGMTIEPRKTNVYPGQREKLSNSDILRINKLYHCPEEIPSEGAVIVFNETAAAAPPIAGCPETSQKGFSDVVFANSSVASTLSSSEALTTASTPGTNKSAVGTADFHFSSPGLFSVSASFPIQQSISAPTDFLNTSTQEPIYSFTSLRIDATLEATRRPSTSSSIKDDNSTLLNTHKTTDQISDDYKTGFTTDISSLGSSVSNSEFSTSESTSTVSTFEETSLPGTSWPTMDNDHILEGKSTLQTFTISQNGDMQQQTITENTRSSSGLDVNASSNQDHEHVKKNGLLSILRKRSLAEKTLGSWSEHHPRWQPGNKLIYSYHRSSKIIEPFCGFEHGFCGWKQSTEDDLDWKLSWGSINVTSRHFVPEGFHLSVKSSPEVGVSGQRALLLKPILQPSKCITFWYGSRHNIMGILNVYIASSGQKQKLLWSSSSQDHVKWTKAKIMLPPNLLNNVHVVLEGVLVPSRTSNIAIDHLYIGKCS